MLTTLRRLVLALATIATSVLVWTSPAAAISTDPFCDTVTGVVAGNGWSVTAPTTRHRTGVTSQVCYMKDGDWGPAVWQLQETLRYCYGADLTGIGRFGPKTKAALERAQRLHGITVDGIYGPETFRALRWREYRTTNPTVGTTGCYRPFVGRQLKPAPPAGSYSPYCSTSTTRRAPSGWFAILPSTFGRTTGTVTYVCYLKYGDRVNESVARLQRALRDCYRAGLGATGVYDAATKATVERVQRLHGITANGVYGPATMKAMYWRFYNGTTEHPSERCYSPW